MLSVLITTLLSFSCRAVLGAQSLIVTTGEEFAVSLASVLPGCDLVFNVTTSEGLTAEVEDPNSLILLETISRRKVGDFPCVALIVNHLGNQYVLSEDGNYLVATEITGAGGIRKLWEFPIPAEGFIRALEMTSPNGVHLLVVLFQTANSHSELYLVELPDISLRPSSTVKVDLPKSHVLTSVLLSVIMDFDDTLILALAGHSSEFEAPGRNSLLLYRLSQKREVIFLYEIHSYSETPLNVISLSSLGVILHVLDSALGLLVLEPVFDKLPEFVSRVDLSGYGEPISFRTQVGGINSVIIVTTLGLVAVDFQINAVKSWHESLNLCDEPWTMGDAEFSEQYFFTTGVTAEDTYFQVARTHNPIVSRSWRLSDFIPRGMINPQSPVLLHQLIRSFQYYVIRSDKDALRVFRLELGSAELRARARSTGEFTAVVTGSPHFFPARSVSELFAVEAISPTNSTVFLGAGYYLGATAALQTYRRTGLSAEFSFNPQELFSGPDLHFSIETVNITAGATVTFPSFPPLEERVTCNVSRSAKFVATMGLLFAIDDGAIVMAMDPMKYYAGSLRGEIEGMKIVDVCNKCPGFVVLGELKSGNKVIADLSIKTYQPKTTIGVASCDRIRSEMPFIVCIGPSSVTFLQASFVVISVITAEALGLPSLNITDAEYSYSEYSSTFYIYISCVDNGLFLVAMPIAEPPRLVEFLDREAGKLHILSSYLCRTAANGELTIFDISRAPAVRVIRTLPSWSADAITSVFDLHSYIYVERKAGMHLYDVSVPVHKSLAAVVASGCRHVADEYSLYEICESDGGFTIIRKDVLMKENSSIRVKVNASGAVPGVYRSVLNVKAENSFGAHAEALVAFELIRE